MSDANPTEEEWEEIEKEWKAIDEQKADLEARRMKIIRGNWRSPFVRRKAGDAANYEFTVADRITGLALLDKEFPGHDPQFLERFVELIVRAVSDINKVNEEGANFAISFVKNSKPRDAWEATLAAQAAIIHELLSRASKEAINCRMAPFAEASRRAVIALARAYASHMEACNRYRARGEQKVTVQYRHLSVNDGGQAIVSNDFLRAKHGRGRRRREKLAEAPAPALPHTKNAPMELLGERPAPEKDAAAVGRQGKPHK